MCIRDRYYGDGSRADILHASGAHTAQAIIVCVDDKAAATLAVENVRRECPNAKLVVRAFDREHAVGLVQQDADVVVRETFESALVMGRETLRAIGVDEDEANDLMEQVRQRDAERFALEVAGGMFAGRALVLGNIEHIAPPKHDGASQTQPAAE